MKFPRFLLFLLLAAGASAQPAVSPQAPASQPVSEKRRTELREALMTGSGAQKGAKVTEAAGNTPNRHLSAQERADLRQQLRQQWPDGKPERH